ncbi:DUF4350 domain-containing protein [Paenibacillus sp. TRM 82003]|uniref:DUF4350 domain-containing protein n=1 Tax=Kineococcus sp. TRM81007 TaxID=2925831 RepID=UPI001F586CF8|nr:DUF4350 domain-containing protein [Kineococcus sp. TRM81007]MCI2237883.1 DUF4350 domain-containing protein [Kineococcus sp. TRM81007]MCI3924614.1 DUF4350 domain-containing protein [Paenibacillus sp. TRM 82003]
MSALLEAPGAGSPDTGPAAVGRGRWRGPLLVTALVVGLVLLLTLLTPSTSREALAADSTAPEGARAVARVLQREGVRVRQERTFDATLAAVRAGGPGTTVLVTDPGLVPQQRWEALADAGARLVLAAPDGDALEELDAVAPGLRTTGTPSARTLPPGCDLAAATAAGRARAGGRTYAAPGGSDAASCYGGSYVVLPADPATGRGEVVLLGQPDVLTNRWAALEGDGALALRTLGTSDTVVWYLPDPLDTETPLVPLASLAPPWTGPAAALLLAAGLTTALWRGRRLGRLVTEPLPVVVRAAETVEGHGRLYAGARATGRAAAALRSATLLRLRALVRLDGTAAPADVADQVAWLTGLPARRVLALLDGPDPADDAALVQLAADLDDLERRVRARST